MADSGAIFTADFKETPYWWEALPATDGLAPEAGLTPSSVDVAIIGGGLTGAAAAWELARAGRDVLVLDADEPGRGASSRNHGMIGRTFRHPFKDLKETIGLDGAIGYYRELQEAYETAVARIEGERLDCLYRKCGRFIAALSIPHYEKLLREYSLRAKHLGEDVEFVAPSRQNEIGSPDYLGGVVVRDNGAIQPALYHAAMRARAERVGARFASHAPVTGLRRDGLYFALQTPRGLISARDVLVATNGLTGRVTPWLAERLIPLDAYTIATEPLPSEVAAKLFPRNRIYHDNRKLSNPFFLAPDGSNRLVFASRTGHRAVALGLIAKKVHSDLVGRFPELRSIRLSHAWIGRCAITRDFFPHTGIHEGVHYSLGYCFSGNAMAPYLGTKAALRILGLPHAGTRFESPVFPRAPWPSRERWFLPAAMKYYAWADRREAARRPQGLTAPTE